MNWTEFFANVFTLISFCLLIAFLCKMLKPYLEAERKRNDTVIRFFEYAVKEMEKWSDAE